MKIKTLTLALALTLVASSAQASNSSTPEILSSVSPDSVQKMTNAESSETRGEYLWCPTRSRCQNFFSQRYLPSRQYSDGYLYNAGWNVWLGSYVSR